MYDVKRILVPTDFSPHAVDAFDHAILIAERFGAEVTLLHVDEFPVSPMGATGITSPAVREYQAEKERFFAEQFARLVARPGERNVPVATRVEHGRAYKVIVEESERQLWDLVVIAEHGWTGLSPHLLGSTVERVVRLSRQPVLSVKQGPLKEERPQTILCPTDLSPAGNVALSYALSIAKRNGARLYIQYVSDLDRPEAEADIRQRIPDLREHYPEARDVTVQWLFDRDVEPSNSIIRFAEDRDVDLIVMSVHGRKGIRRVYIGNTAAEVVRQSPRPVLTVTHPLHKKLFSHPLTERVSPAPFLHEERGRP
jgi:nucleotide-binding universal stress UspA family protein